MNSRNKIKAASICICVVATVLLAYLLLCPVSHVSNKPQVVKLRNAACIGYAIFKYKNDHSGHLPTQLSELIPNYISPTNANYFFLPPRYLEPYNSSISTQIDNNGAFVYLGTRGFQADLVLYERTNLWPRNPDVATVTTLTTNDFITRLRSVNDIEARLSLVK